MTTGPILEREEYIEQAYFFRVFRERLAENLPSQEILARIHEEILTTTRLPMAIQFLATDLKHSGGLGNAFGRLLHYFTPFQAFVIQQAEKEGMRFGMPAALLILEREATFKSGTPTRPALFVYQFETLCRNRLGYMEGVGAMGRDPLYDDAWRHYLDTVARQVGIVDFAELIYLRSELYVRDEQRRDPGYRPPVEPLFGDKEGKIAKASLHRDPLYLFSALQRQLGYPEVPRPRPKDDANAKVDAMSVKLREIEARIKLLEGEMRGTIDLTQLAKPDLLKDDD
jgi:hypothetical protein